MFVSGQIPVTSDNKVPEDFEAQARQAWANLIAQLHAADMTLDNLVKVTSSSPTESTFLNIVACVSEVLAGRKIA